MQRFARIVPRPPIGRLPKPILILAMVALGGAIGVGLAVLAWPLVQREEQSAQRATLAVTSAPPGATVVIDDREWGVTPLTVAVPPGTHRVVVRKAGMLDSPPESARMDAGGWATLHVTLWAASPEIVPLRSPAVGQTIVEATPLDDGCVGLVVTPYRQGDRREAWSRCPDGSLHRIGPRRRATALAIAPDGRRVAYLVPSQGATDRPPVGTTERPRPDELWITSVPGETGVRRLALADEPALRGSALTSVAWAPDGRRLLATALGRRPDESPFTTFLLLAADAGPSPRLPAIDGEVVPGSWAWSPNGDRIAFLAEERERAKTVLVVLEPGAPTEVEQARNVADVVVARGGHLPTSPLAWSPDGQAVLFPATVAAGGGLFSMGGGERAGYALHDLGPGPPRPLAGPAGQGAVWREAHAILTLATGRDGQVALNQTTLDAMAPGNPPVPRPPITKSLAAVPLRPGSTPMGARWDLARRRLLLVMPGRNGGRDDLDWWLIQW